MNRPLIDFAGQAILITGGSSGIGADCAILLSELGAKVALVGRNEVRLNDTHCKLAGDGHRVYAFDLSSTRDIDDLVKAVVSEFGPLSGLVHSAGLQVTKPLRALRIEEIESVYQTNTFAAIMLLKALRVKGRYVPKSTSAVLVSSISGMIGVPGEIMYGSSKAATNLVARAAGLELIAEGIRVNAVAPALVNTSMTSAFMERLSEDQVNAILSKHPMGVGEPRDASNAIVFLLSEMSRWITGSTIVLDGGYTAG